MGDFVNKPNFVRIDSFYVLSDEEALKSDLPKLIFVLGKVQEFCEAEDKMMHSKWDAVYVEVEFVNEQLYGKCNTLTMDIEALNMFYSKLN